MRNHRRHRIKRAARLRKYWDRYDWAIWRLRRLQRLYFRNNTFMNLWFNEKIREQHLLSVTGEPYKTN